MSGSDPPGDPPEPDPRETDAGKLTEAEMGVTVAAVRAVVERDRPALEAMKAFDAGDPYGWTREYGHRQEVHLVVPPGDPRAWTMHVVRGDAEERLAVEVDMWTREEGRSDLTLELELRRRPDGSLNAEFHNLHVM